MDVKKAQLKAKAKSKKTSAMDIKKAPLKAKAKSKETQASVPNLLSLAEAASKYKKMMERINAQAEASDRFEFALEMARLHFDFWKVISDETNADIEDLEKKCSESPDQAAYYGPALEKLKKTVPGNEKYRFAALEEYAYLDRLATFRR